MSATKPNTLITSRFKLAALLTNRLTFSNDDRNRARARREKVRPRVAPRSHHPRRRRLRRLRRRRASQNAVVTSFVPSGAFPPVARSFVPSFIFKVFVPLNHAETTTSQNPPFFEVARMRRNLCGCIRMSYIATREPDGSLEMSNFVPISHNLYLNV